MAQRLAFVAANYKLNPGTKAQVKSLVDQLNAAKWATDKVQVVIAPTAAHLDFVRSTVKGEVGVAGQNVYHEETGAFTGENSPTILKDLNVEWVILGHSERRNIFKETDQDVAKKTIFALQKGLKVILCVGELLSEREANKTTEVVFRQLQAVKDVVADWTNVVIAYEPVWAIGTGKNATAKQAQEVHNDIRNWLKSNINQATAEATRIVYGGSVNAKNCSELSSEPDIDGFLVGGASLKPEFVEIIHSKM